MVVWRLLRQEPALIVSAGYVLLSLLGLWSSYFFLPGLPAVDPGLPAGERFPGRRPARSGVRGDPGGRRPAGDPGRLAGHAAPTQPGPGGRTAGAALGLAGAVFAFGADQLGHVRHAATHGCVHGGGVLHGAGSGHLLPGQGREHPRKRAGQRCHRASGRRYRRVAGTARLLGSSTGFVFLWWPQQKRAEAVPISAIKRMQSVALPRPVKATPARTPAAEPR